MQLGGRGGETFGSLGKGSSEPGQACHLYDFETPNVSIDMNLNEQPNFLDLPFFPYIMIFPKFLGTPDFFDVSFPRYFDFLNFWVPPNFQNQKIS